MVRIVLVLLCALCSAVPAWAEAGEDPLGVVVRIEGGGARGDVKWPLATGLGQSREFGAALGWRFHPHFRVEAAYAKRDDFSYQGRDGTYTVTGKANNATYMANLYADLFPIGRVTPFVGVGGGRSVTELNTADYASGATTGHRIGSTATNWAWQATIGAGIAVVDGLKLDAAYRFVHTGRMGLDRTGDVAGVSGTFNSDLTSSLNINELLVGLRAEF